MYHRLASLLLCASLAPLSHAQFGPEPTARPSNPDQDPAYKLARQTHAENLAKHEGNAEVLVLPGVLADRKTKLVKLWGKATGLSPDDPCEFFLIPPDSGKDYEALFLVYAKPSDVHRALQFVGVKPGNPVKFEANRFWPKGERVVMKAQWEERDENNKPTGKSLEARAEDLIVDVRTNKPLPPTGLVFTGSFWITPEEAGFEGKQKMYAADVADPRSIASNYNDRTTVLDLPRQAPQGEVYGRQKANPQYRFAPGQPITVTLEPELKDGTTRVRDLKLSIDVPSGKRGVGAARFSLTDSEGKPLGDGNTLVHVLAEFEKLNGASKDVYLTVHVEDSVTLADARAIFKVLGAMDNPQGIRMEPPGDADLFYRAFFPKEEWRDRTQRLGRPWELHLTEKDGRIVGKMDLPADDIDRQNGRTDRSFDAPTADEFARVLAKESDRWSQTVYVFAPDTMRYGDLMKFIRKGLETHPTMWVFSKTP